MAKSHTKRKKARAKQRPLLDDPRVDLVLSMAVKYLHDWTHRELENIISTGNVFILPGKNKDEYKIGKFDLMKFGNHCWTVCHFDRVIHNFYDRRAALFYCMTSQTTYSTRAEEVLMLDGIVGKLQGDYTCYLSSLSNARKKHNWHQYDTAQARLSQVSTKLDYVQEQLEKSLVWAKYKKTQDGSHETTRTRN